MLWPRAASLHAEWRTARYYDKPIPKYGDSSSDKILCLLIIPSVLFVWWLQWYCCRPEPEDAETDADAEAPADPPQGMQAPVEEQIPRESLDITEYRPADYPTQGGPPRGGTRLKKRQRI